MKKILFISMICIVSLFGCSQEADEDKKTKEDASTAGENEDKTVNEEEDEGENDESNPETEEEDVFFLNEKDPYSIEGIDIDSVFNDDGDIEKSHTEQEIAQEYMDDDGRIYFDLDDHPVRNITSDDGNVNHITNYHDAYIDISENEAYTIDDEEEMEQTYEFFIMNPPEELADKEPEDYRTWEEATNLERGIMQLTILSAPSLNELGILVENDTYSGEDFEKLLDTFKELGDPGVLIPAPQTILDMQLYENMQMIQSYMGEIGTFEDPEENEDEFKELYYEFRQEYNNVVVRVNYTLSEEDPNDPSD